MHLCVYLTALAVLPGSWGFLNNILSASKIAGRISQPSNLISLGCLEFPVNTAIVAAFDSDSLTFERCQDFCVSASHKYFGVTKGHTCVCMDSAFTALPKASKENCFTGCAGNLYEQSGNERYIQAFSASSTSLVRSLKAGWSLTSSPKDSKKIARDLPTVLDSREISVRGASAETTALGCWQFPVGSALMIIQGNLNPANFRVEDCQMYCSSYSYFGVTTTCNQTSSASIVTVTITPTASTSTVLRNITQLASTSTIIHSATVTRKITQPVSTSTIISSATVTQNITLPGFTSTIITCSNTSSSAWETASSSKIISSTMSSIFSTANTNNPSITSSTTQSSLMTTLLLAPSSTSMSTSSTSSGASSLARSSPLTASLATAPTSTRPTDNTNSAAPVTIQSSLIGIFATSPSISTPPGSSIGQTGGQTGVPNTFNPSDGSNGQTAEPAGVTNTFSPSDSSMGQTAGPSGPTNTLTPPDGSNGQATGTSSATNTFSTTSPTSSPSNSSGIVATSNTVCTPFITFYQNVNLNGLSWPQCGTPGTCYNVDSSWKNQASSIHWQSGVNCTLYHGASCTGISLLVTPEITAAYGVSLWYPWMVFNDMLVSYTCF